MNDAKSLRAQAELCLEIASHMSDAAAVRQLNADADRYRAMAEEIDRTPEPRDQAGT